MRPLHLRPHPPPENGNVPANASHARRLPKRGEPRITGQMEKTSLRGPHIVTSERSSSPQLAVRCLDPWRRWRARRRGSCPLLLQRRHCHTACRPVRVDASRCLPFLPRSVGERGRIVKKGCVR